MKAYGYVKKGISHRNGVCEDSALLGNVLLKEGYGESELGNHFMAAVADGVGGNPSGQVASGLVLLGLLELGDNAYSEDQIQNKLVEINQRITEIGSRVDSCTRMASTLTLLVKGEQDLFVCQFGNSRLYAVTDDGFQYGMTLITRDRTVLCDLQDGKSVVGLPENASAGDVIGTRQANLLTSHVGMQVSRFEQEMVIQKIENENVKRWFITSDGVHDFLKTLSYDERLELFTKMDDPKAILEGIVNAALQNGSEDDLSVVMVE